MNLNFNTNLIKTNDLKERYNFEDFRLVNLKEQYNLVKTLSCREKLYRIKNNS